MKIALQPLDEIIKEQPKLDDLNWGEICAIVAKGRGLNLKGGSPEQRYPAFEGSFYICGDDDGWPYLWPAYQCSREQAMELLEAIPYNGLSFWKIKGSNVFELCLKFPSNDEIAVRLVSEDMKLFITKAAAKCVLAGIELEDQTVSTGF